MRSLILAATATLAILSGFYIYSNTPSTTRLLTTPIYSQAQLDAWTTWKMNYGKTYGVDSQEQYRKSVFMANYAKVNLHNTMMGRTYEMALNYFADLPAEEFAAKYLGFVGHKNLGAEKDTVELSETSLPDSRDWRGVAVSDVKDQGQCGSCWSFSTTGAIEGAYAIKYGNIKSLSEQQ